MLCFVFSALIVAFDQFLKHWILRTLDVGEIGPEIIPGVLGLTRWENDGAMLNILSGQQWLLAGIAFVAAVVLIMILLRYNEGFWGTLGLAAVLGGTIGNLIDRVLNDGKVVDMFMTIPFKFPIFNIADVFITLGFITFLIHFIALSFKSENKERSVSDYGEDEYYEEQEEPVYDEFPEIDSIVAAQSEQEVASSSAQYAPDQQYNDPYGVDPQYSADSQYQQQYTEDPQYQQQYAEDPQYQQQYAEDPQYSVEPDVQAYDSYDPITDTTTDTSFSLDALEAELGSLDDYGDYDVDDLLREYGFNDDE